MTKIATQIDAFCSTGGFIRINNRLIQKFGAERALYISNLIDGFKYFYENNKLKDEEWFFLTHKNQMKKINLSSKKRFLEIKKDFIQLGIIEVKRMGLPAKEYYKINLNNLEDILDDESIDHEKLQIMLKSPVSDTGHALASDPGQTLASDTGQTHNSELINSEPSNSNPNENHRFSIRTFEESTSPTRKRKRKKTNSSNPPTKSKNSIKDKINGKKKELSAQSSKKKKTILYYTKPNVDLINLWNKQENLRSHLKTDSKTYQQSLKKLEMLRKGTLHKIVNKDHLQDHISKDHISKPWRKSEIAKAIKTLNEWCKEGNLPHKKDWIKKISLGDAIFCAQYGSVLISAFITGVKSVYDPTKNFTNDEELFAYNKLEQFFLSNNGNALNVKKKQQIVDLVKSLKGLREEHSGNWKIRSPEDFGYGYTPNNLKSLVIDYCEFLNGKFIDSEFVPNSSLTPNGLKVGSYVWSQFEKAYRNRFGADPISGPEV